MGHYAAYGFSEYIATKDVDFVIYFSDDNRYVKLHSEEEKTELSPREALELAIDDLNRLADARTIDQLVDFLWHHQRLDDPPGSYNHVIALQKRAIEIDPGYRQQYFDTAWLLYSQWVMWNNNPEKTPSMESKINEAIEVLEKGSEEFGKSAEYHYIAALTIDPQGWYNIPGVNEFAENMLMKADQLAGEEEQKLKIRVRLMLGVSFRRREMEEEAEKWFRRILELDPENEAARRYLGKMQ